MLVTLALLASFTAIWMIVLIVARARRGERIIAAALAGAGAPRGSSPRDPAIRLYVLLPCFEEQPVIAATLDHLLAATHAEPATHLVVITGESERVARGARNADGTPRTTTWEIVDRWLAAHPEATGKVSRLHEPASVGTKATKLNFAAVTLPQRDGVDPRTTYFAIYDADSRPHPGTFAVVLDRIAAAHAAGTALPSLLQQVPHVLGSQLARLPSTSLPFLASIAHLERSLAGELVRDLADQRTSRLRYGMGAGMFIRLDVVTAVGGFPECSDDIAFGYRLDLRGVPRELVPHPNLVQPVLTAGALSRQYQRIRLGLGSVWNELDAYLELAPADPGRARYRAALGALDAHDAFNRPGRAALAVLAAVLAGLALGPVAAIAFLAGHYVLEAALLLILHGVARRVRRLAGQRDQLGGALALATLGPLRLPLFQLGGVLRSQWRRARLRHDRAAALALAGDKTDRV